MPNQLSFSCKVCDKVFTHKKENVAFNRALECERSHELITVTLPKNALINLANLMMVCYGIGELENFFDKRTYRVLKEAVKNNE